MPKALSKQELQNRARAKGLPVSGTCAQLRQRLKLKPVKTHGEGCAPKKSVKISPQTTKRSTSKTATTPVKIGNKKLAVPNPCFRGYEIKKKMGEGAWGVVHQSCDMKNNCSYAIKLQKLPTRADHARWIKEVELSKLFAQINVGPKFYGAWYCAMVKTGLIVLEKWDDTLENADKPPKKLIDKLEGQIKRMHDVVKLVHGDILPKNVLVKKQNGRIVDITLSDFGTVMTVDNWQGDNVKTFYAYHTNPAFPSSAYFKKNKITLAQVQKNPMLLDKALIWHLRQTK